jgi:nucleoside-diphosphate-sugar epimerase
MAEISVFGGTGFVGGEFCRTTEQKVQLVDRESRSPLSLESLYFISTTDNYNVFDDVHKDVDINLTILLDVLKNLEPGKSVFNFVSSWFVYGDAPLPADESSNCNPKGFYSITKRAAEQLIISYCETFNIEYRILRLSNVIGPGDKGISKRKNALQFLIDKLKKNEKIELYHNGEFYRDYMYVTDVARAIDLCIKTAPTNQVYNIGSGEKVLFKDLINLVIEETNSKSEIGTIEPPHFHKTIQVKDFYFSTQKLKDLGFKQTITLQEGVKLLCQ